jgi:hypothetical protein
MFVHHLDSQGQLLVVVLIVVSFLALMLLIYFLCKFVYQCQFFLLVFMDVCQLVEDILKERIEPIYDRYIPSKSHTIEEIRTTTRQHDSPILSVTPHVDESAVVMPTSLIRTPTRQLSASSLPGIVSPLPKDDINASIVREKSPSLSARTSPAHAINFDKIRQGQHC